MSGTEGQLKRLEAIKIELEGTKEYSIMYRVHVQDIGWQEWKYDGEIAGTEGQSKRLEAIEIKIVDRKAQVLMNIDEGKNGTVYYRNDKIKIRGWKMADFMIALERRIEAQQSLVDSLKKYKRGLLRKVFAKLSDSCEKRNLKEVSVLFADGDWIESKDQALDGIRLIQTGNVGFGVYIDKTQNAKYISETTFHRLNCLEIYDGDILISRLPEPAGRACLLPKSTERRITAVDCTVIRTDSSVIDRNYLLQFLCSEQYLKTVNSFLAGGTRQRISRKNLEGIEVPYPSIDEQRYWGSFLCKVDARISNEEQRRSSLSRLRCFMLQQLFI